jgi:hypothetical protein
LIEQRTEVDCAICCIAMATGRPYEQVHAAGVETGAFDPDRGCRSEGPILRALGLTGQTEVGDPSGDFMTRRCPYAVPAEFFRELAWGRRALITTRSLNDEAALHVVFWDGSQLFDPSPKQRYERFADLKVQELTVFREAEC